MNLFQSRLTWTISWERLRSTSISEKSIAELDNAEQTFFNTISREFYSPLKSILAPLEYALANLDESSKDSIGIHLEEARKNSMTLIEHMNTLLSFSKKVPLTVQSMTTLIPATSGPR